MGDFIFRGVVTNFVDTQAQGSVVEIWGPRWGVLWILSCPSSCPETLRGDEAA